MSPPSDLHRAIQRLEALIKAIVPHTGDALGWEYNFRVGHRGVTARFASCELLSAMMTDWSLVVLPHQLIGGFGTALLWTEAHAASLLFNMDSAIETLVYTANALGNAIDPTVFRNVADDGELKQVSPCDVLDPTTARTRKGKLAPTGHETHFVRFTAHLRNNASLIEDVQEHHDVTKHRHGGLSGGTQRNDPPPEILRALGIAPQDHAKLIHVSPMSEVLLGENPKAPHLGKAPGSLHPRANLLYLMTLFRVFVPTAVGELVKDVEDVCSARGWPVAG